MPIEDTLGGSGAVNDLCHGRRLVALLRNDCCQGSEDALGRVIDRIALRKGLRFPASPSRTFQGTRWHGIGKTPGSDVFGEAWERLYFLTIETPLNDLL